VTDYALAFITINGLLKLYEAAIRNKNYQEAADIAVDIQLLSVELQQWAEDAK
jgi:hypothetical protein